MKMWGGYGDGRIYRSSSSSPAYSFGRGRHTKRYWILENERGAIAKHILSGKTTAEMGTMETAEKMFPKHGDVVEESSIKTNPFTFHT
jgi:hypothetical protein